MARAQAASAPTRHQPISLLRTRSTLRPSSRVLQHPLQEAALHFTLIRSIAKMNRNGCSHRTAQQCVRTHTMSADSLTLCARRRSPSPGNRPPRFRRPHRAPGRRGTNWGATGTRWSPRVSRKINAIPPPDIAMTGACSSLRSSGRFGPGQRERPCVRMTWMRLLDPKVSAQSSTSTLDVAGAIKLEAGAYVSWMRSGSTPTRNHPVRPRVDRPVARRWTSTGAAPITLPSPCPAAAAGR